MTAPCPVCGVVNDDDWPLDVGDKVAEGGCQMCWEDDCSKSWWRMMEGLPDEVLES